MRGKEGKNNSQKYFYLTCFMNTSGLCFFPHSVLIKRGEKDGERGNLSLLNRELHDVLYPDRLSNAKSNITMKN